MMLRWRGRRRSAVFLLFLLHACCDGGFGQTCTPSSDSLQQLEERFTCLESSLDQLLQSSHPKDCSDISTDEDHASGVYTIQPKGSHPFRALCQFDGEGRWTVLQRRVNGATEFQRPWLSYRNGFGQLSYTSNLWLGLEKMYYITRQRQYRLRIDLLGWGGERTFAEYSIFYIRDEDAKYAIYYSGYSGTAGDKLGEHHLWAVFSTSDRDNDKYADSSMNCALTQGPWWLNACDTANLNGQYGEGTDDTGIEWGEIKSFKETTMRIRPTYADELDWENH